ncbi:hypothetical protein J7J18_04495 [bacterium]|nr:hypothetical protein [bacterium]
MDCEERKFRGIEFNGYVEENGKQKMRGGAWVKGDLHCDGENVYIFDREGSIWRKVYPETVGQYTGAKDDNGKEIWEGDIVRFMDRGIGYVVFSEGAFGVREGNIDNVEDDEMEVIGFGYYKIEVIGNVYENPELLQRQEDE